MVPRDITSVRLSGDPSTHLLPARFHNGLSAAAWSPTAASFFAVFPNAIFATSTTLPPSFFALVVGSPGGLRLPSAVEVEVSTSTKGALKNKIVFGWAGCPPAGKA